MKYFFLGLKNFRKISGRANFLEFWWFNFFGIISFISSAFLFSGINFIANTFTYFYDILNYTSCLLILFWWIYLIIAFITVYIRRLHDLGLSGWFVLIPILPFFYANFKQTSEGDNKYGPPSQN